MGIFFGKRGNLVELVLSPMFKVLIVLLLVFLPLLYYTSSVGKSTFFEREFITRDVGLLVEALQASPNDAYVDYKPRTQLEVRFNKDSVSASEYSPTLKKALPKSTVYTIFGSKTAIVETTITPKTTKQYGKDENLPYTMSFVKANDQIMPSAGSRNIPAEEANKYCEMIFETFYGNWENDKKTYVEVYSKDSSSFAFAASICSKLTVNLGFYPKQGCTEHSLGESLDIITQENPDILIILYVNPQKDAKNNVNIYYLGGENTDKSKKLACMIQTYLQGTGIQYESYSKTSELPSDLLSLIPLINGRLALIVEVGNINTLTDTDSILISNAIKNAVAMYYGT